MTGTLVEPQIETRSGDGYQIAEVDFPKRIVTVLAMPYERPTEIFDRGQVFTEVVSKNAFSGMEKRTSKIRANRDHSWDKPVGRIVGLHTSRREGLVAEVKVSRTDLGNDTLELCEDDVLSASAGFRLLCRDGGSGPVYEDAEVWEAETTRRLNRLWLDHLAFVPNPAYPDAAVLSVRNAVARPREPAGGGHTFVPAPNLAQVRVDALKAAEADMNRRYTRPSE
jgi:phage head maturation protease